MKDFLKAVVYAGLFIIPFLTLYVANDYFFPYITGKNFYFRIIVEVIFGAWIALSLLDARFRPKFSWLLSGFSLFLLVMFVADWQGAHRASSFWSNFERMEGFITLVHLYLYFVVLSSVLTTKKAWSYFLNTALVGAVLVSVNGLGSETARAESYLGNAAYLAIYMLFHIFIAWWLLFTSKENWQRVIYGLLSLLFIYLLLKTGTRGTALGLVAGVGTLVSYVAIFGRQIPDLRKLAIGAVAVVGIAIVAFIGFKDSGVIQNNPSLARIANIDLKEDLRVRGVIWSMAWEGIKERPILGWGQSNFNFIFNEKYEPFLFDQEQWFDRTHEIILDWLVAGGFVGLFAYLSLFVACLYYLIVVPLRNKDDETFTVLERAVLLGILVGYFVHNLVVFDNIISYIFFVVFLALLHSRVATPIKEVEKMRVDTAVVSQAVLPVVAILVVFVVYTVNLPGMNAAQDIIKAYRTDKPAERLQYFEDALNRNSFGHQEIVEQLAQQAMRVAGSTDVPEDIRQNFIILSEEELNKLVTEKPGDTRIHVFFANFYRSINNLEGAKEQIDIARSLSPNKQSVIAQQGIIAYSFGDNEAARDYFAESLALDERNDEARGFYAAMLFLTGENDKAEQLATTPEQIAKMADNTFLVKMAEMAGADNFLIKIFRAKLDQNPKDPQAWSSLSTLYYNQGNTDEAVAVLEEGIVAVPAMKKVASCFIDNIKNDRLPEFGCFEDAE